MNRLARERSPYLLQHASNPVDWFSWGEEAFAKARSDDKPIFLSIGYSTCHWCHVMERESFENDAVAAVLNQHFVSIKVDREERPDVDRVYMMFVQATTGSGGWPMSVWLTPDRKPFYGGTYFPPSSQWGRPAFTDILNEIARVWRGDRAKVEQSADALTSQLRQFDRAAASTMPKADALDRAVGQFKQAFDSRRGGFGGAPKFPRPSELMFLLREHARTRDGETIEMVLRTLRAMALGGMRDHVGGGFHRYSVDAGWRVPHFEKMLYDQAQLVLAFLEAAQASGDAFYAEVAQDTLFYVQREMTDEGGGFFSAEDADSVPPETGAGGAGEAGGAAGAGVAGGAGRAEKKEGAFYLWRADEVDALLGPDAGIVKQRFGVEPGGNAPIDPQHEFTGKNLLYIARSIDEIAGQTGGSAAEMAGALNRARLRMFEARAGRPRPHLDDKVLTAWNGLMIGAFARGARVLRAIGPMAGFDGPRVRLQPDTTEGFDPRVRLPALRAADGKLDTSEGVADPGDLWLGAARRAASFVRDRMWNPASRTLLRRYRDGDAAIEGYAEDYAFLIFGVLELFQTDPDPAWLQWAIDLQRRQDELFWDDEDAGWFSTTGRDASVLLRAKEDYDGAEPTASSVSVMNLLVLSHLVDDPAWRERVERTLRLFGSRLDEMGRAVPMMAAALSTYTAGLQQIVIVGEEGREELARTLARRYLPFAVTLSVSADRQRDLAALLPFIAAMAPIDGRAAVYLCRDFACQQPVTAVEDLKL